MNFKNTNDKCQVKYWVRWKTQKIISEFSDKPKIRKTNDKNDAQIKSPDGSQSSGGNFLSSYPYKNKLTDRPPQPCTPAFLSLLHINASLNRPHQGVHRCIPCFRDASHGGAVKKQHQRTPHNRPYAPSKRQGFFWFFSF